MKCKLREFQLNDAESFAKHANNKSISDRLTDQFPHPYNTDHAIFFIENIVSNPKNLIRVIDIDGEACGAIGIHGQDDVYRKNAEMGYWLGEQFWGNGIISQLIPEMLDLTFRLTDFERVFARPFGSNLASKRVLEKSGYNLEAVLNQTFFKNGAYEDELIFAVRRTDKQEWSV